MSIEGYLNTITSQHRTQPRFIAMLSALLAPADDVQALLNLWNFIFDVDEAEGDALDKIGERVGCARTMDLLKKDSPTVELTDDYYRVCIKVRILNNQWNGRIIDLMANFRTMFPDYTLTVHDRQDMSMRVIVEGIQDDLLMRLLVAGHLLPKPEGVRMEIVIRIVRDDASTIYTGIAHTRHITSDITSDAPDIQDATFLTDETGAILTDETGAWLTA